MKLSSVREYYMNNFSRETEELVRNTVVFGRNDDLYVLGGSGDGSVEFVSSDVVSAVISLKNQGYKPCVLDLSGMRASGVE